MPKRGRVPDDLQFFGMLALFLAVLGIPLVRGPATDDPYFQQDICDWMTVGGRAVITAAGMPTDCVEADRTHGPHSARTAATCADATIGLPTS